jgi:hypothetical protein
MDAWLANKKTATYTVAKNASDNLDASDVALTSSGGTPQWWDIDPSSASVVGRLPGGWGTELEEEGITLHQMHQAYDVFEISETAGECAHGGGGCEAEICKLTVSGIPMAVHALGDAEVATGALVLEFLSVKLVGGAGCGGLERGGEGGGEGGGEPSPEDGTGPG